MDILSILPTKKMLVDIIECGDKLNADMPFLKLFKDNTKYDKAESELKTTRPRYYKATRSDK